ncbi:MAG: glycosyltransferase family 2 protein [Anaerolineae bacterium]
MRTSSPTMSRYVDASIACIIPAHNEAGNIARVLEPVCQVQEFSRIIVVDDCSTDATVEVVRSFAQHEPRLMLLALPTNVGKAGAMVAGAEASQCDLVLFVDADLLGIRPEHLRALFEPVRQGTCSMTIAAFVAGRWLTDLAQRTLPFLSGQRCVVWGLYRDTPDLTTARYGAEVALCLHAVRMRSPVRMVPWPGTSFLLKGEKLGLVRGWGAYVRMYSQILRYTLLHLPLRRWGPGPLPARERSAGAYPPR